MTESPPGSTQVQHTPGPWFVLQVPTSAGSAFRIGAAEAHRGCTWIYADGICKGIDDELPRARELAANARLIAAAPDLLATLVDLDARLRECFELGHQITPAEVYDSSYQESVRAAISKALPPQQETQK